MLRLPSSDASTSGHNMVASFLPCRSRCNGVGASQRLPFASFLPCRSRCNGVGASQRLPFAARSPSLRRRDRDDKEAWPSRSSQAGPFLGIPNVRGNEIDISSRSSLSKLLMLVPDWADAQKESNMLQRQQRAFYSHDDWLRHRSSLRHIRHLVSSLSSRVILFLIPPVFIATFISAVITVYNLAVASGLLPSAFPILHAASLPYELTAPALALLLVFRTGASYSIYDEARKTWTVVLSSSKDFARQSMQFIRHSKDITLRSVLLKYIMAFPVALKCHLSYASDIGEDLTNWLDLDFVLSSRHRPNCLIQLMSQAVALARLEDSERSLLLTLPVILWDACNWLVVRATFFSAATLFCIEEAFNGSETSKTELEASREQIDKQAEESKQGLNEAVNNNMEKASKVEDATESNDSESVDKILGILRDTTEQLKDHAEKAREVFSVTAQETAVRSKENLSFLAEKGPESIRDIADTALKAHFPETARKGARIHDFCLGIPYGALLAFGGLIWFILSGSTAAIRFGVILGGVILALSMSSLKVWKQGKSSMPYIMAQAAITSILLVRELRRYLEERSFFPYGVAAIVSAGMLVFYLYVYISGGNPPKKGKNTATSY